MKATWIRNFPIGDDLIQEDAEGPHIRLDSETSEVDGFRGGPLDGEFST